MKDLEVGSWTYTLKRGVWQIYRIQSYVGLNHLTNAEEKQKIYFAKRFVNDSYKKSFGEACFPEDCLFAIAGEEADDLNQFIEENRSIFCEFENYRPKPLDCIYNASIRVPEGRSVTDIVAELAGDRMYRQNEIAPLIKSLHFETSGFPRWTLQFVSPNFTCQDGFLVFKFSCVLEF